MAIRVSKPTFNIRDKLAELQRPIGTNGAALMKTESSKDAFSLIGAGRKNIVINGDMRIDQRNSGSSVNLATTGEVYPCDRFLVEQGGISGNTGTVQQVTDAPDGFSHSIKYTSGAVTFSDNAGWSAINQRIEGSNLNALKWGTISAEYVTLSFWVKSSYTGTFSLNLTHYDGSVERWNLQEYTIQNKNVWEYKTLTFAPDKDHGIGESGWMRLYWHLITNFSAGSASASNRSIADLNTHQGGTGQTRGSVRSVCLNRSIGETFFLTGVQLEVGRVSTPFEYRSYSEELALCQRYYYKINSATNNAPYQRYAVVSCETSTDAEAFFLHPVTMRANPTLGHSAATSFHIFTANATRQVTGMGIDQTSTMTTGVALSVSSGLTAAGVGLLDSDNNNTSYIEFIAEL